MISFLLPLSLSLFHTLLSGCCVRQAVTGLTHNPLNMDVYVNMKTLVCVLIFLPYFSFARFSVCQLFFFLLSFFHTHPIALNQFSQSHFCDVSVLFFSVPFIHILFRWANKNLNIPIRFRLPRVGSSFCRVIKRVFINSCAWHFGKCNLKQQQKKEERNKSTSIQGMYILRVATMTPICLYYMFHIFIVRTKDAEVKCTQAIC